MSSVRQIVQHIKTTLRELTWPDGAQEVVFGDSVYTSADDIKGALPHLRRPFALISVGSSRQDSGDAYLYQETVYIDLVTWVEQGFSGDASILGAGQIGGEGSSQGRGITEIETVVKNTLARIASETGLKSQGLISGADPVGPISDVVYGAARRLRIEIWATVEDTFPAPKFLRATGGSGSVTLRFWEPPQRSDFSELVLRRASGATPPATPSAGTGVTVVSGATSAVDSVSAGGYAYSLWAKYGSEYSSPRTATATAT